MNLSSQKSKSFGLDISDLCLRVANIEKKGKGFELVSFGCETIKKGIVKEGEIKNEDALAEAIRKALSNVKGKKIKTKNVVCSLPEEKSFLDVLQLPMLGEEEMAQAVRFEAANHIPVPLEEVYFDFQINKSIGEDNKDKSSTIKEQNVLIAATPKIIVDAYSRVLKKAGLRAQIMEVEPLAIARALVKTDKVTKPLLIIDFGASRTSFIIFSGYNANFASTISVSSNELTEAIAEKLKISNSKAEKLKKTNGLEGDKMVFDAMSPVLNNLTSQIKNYLDYYKSHVPSAVIIRDSKVDRILLCGGGAHLMGLGDFLTSTFKIKVELANPWINIKAIKQQGTPLSSFLGYPTALGLGLRGAQL